jgi:hypothetical protein
MTINRSANATARLLFGLLMLVVTGGEDGPLVDPIDRQWLPEQKHGPLRWPVAH